MFTTQVALVPHLGLEETTSLFHRQLVLVASALQTQLSRDFGPTWGVSAVVTPFLCLEDLPPQYLPVIVTPEALPGDHHGFHLAADGRPFALVHQGDGWSLSASHELMEMVLDPGGLLTVSGPSLRDAYHRATGQDPVGEAAGGTGGGNYAQQGTVDYLVEPCDPVEGASYTIDGVAVSDFVTQHYYQVTGGQPRRCSFLGTVSNPLEIADGGYLSWRTHDPLNSVWQATATAPADPTAETSSTDPQLVCGTAASHLSIGPLKGDGPGAAPRPGAADADDAGAPPLPDDFVSRFSRDQVALRSRRARATEAASVTIPNKAWADYAKRFRRDVGDVIDFLSAPPPPTLHDVITLLREARDTKSRPDDLLAKYKIPDGGYVGTPGEPRDLDAIIALLERQENISNILDSNASDPDLASWLCRLMP
jgi:hypothetical protein